MIRKRVEEPDLVLGIHPGLHAEGVYEFWEPTLELLLDKEIVTCFTVLNKEEFQQSLERLDALFCRYLYKGLNTFASHHVKQTPHDADLMWASNMYLIIFKVSFGAKIQILNFSILFRITIHVTLICFKIFSAKIQILFLLLKFKFYFWRENLNSIFWRENLNSILGAKI